MKRLQPQQSASGQHGRGSKTTVSEMSRSMMDLSVHNTDTNLDERGVPVPRFKAGVSGYFSACEGLLEEDILLTKISLQLAEILLFNSLK